MKEQNVNNKVKLEYADDLIFKFIFLPNEEPDIETAQEAVRIVGEWSTGIAKRATLIDARNLVFISSKVRKYFGAQKRENLVAVALVIGSSVQKTLANLYMKFTNRATPTKVFNNYEDAVEWLHSEIKTAMTPVG